MDRTAMSTIGFCKTTSGGLAIEGGERLTRLFHDRHNIIEADLVNTVGQQSKMATTERTRCCMGIPFNAGDLDQTSHWITGQTQMMFQTHLSGILNLPDGASHDLRGCGRSHGARGPHFS